MSRKSFMLDGENPTMPKTCINCREPIPGTDLYDMGNPMVCEKCVKKRKEGECEMSDVTRCDMCGDSISPGAYSKYSGKCAVCHGLIMNMREDFPKTEKRDYLTAKDLKKRKPKVSHGVKCKRCGKMISAIEFASGSGKCIACRQEGERILLRLERIERQLTEKVIRMFHTGMQNNHSVDELFDKLDAVEMEMMLQKVEPQKLREGILAIEEAKSAEAVEMLVHTWHEHYLFDEEATAKIVEVAETKMKSEGWK